jgi:hypothetical protein
MFGIEMLAGDGLPITVTVALPSISTVLPPPHPWNRIIETTATKNKQKPLRGPNRSFLWKQESASQSA